MLLAESEQTRYDGAAAEFPKHAPFIQQSAKGTADLLEAEIRVVNPQVLLGDVNRTRAGQQTDTTRKHMAAILARYCEKAELGKYIQGMNELLAPIYFLEHEQAKLHKREEKLYQVFNCFSLMVCKLLPTTFQDEEFISLQCLFAVLEMLLKYHAPGIALELSRNSLGCELYAMGWLMTFFANKLDLKLVHHLWPRIFQEKDKLFVLFLSVALIMRYRQQIFATDSAMLPQLLTSFTLKSESQIDELIARACSLRDETPHSFCLFVESTGIFSPTTSKHSYRHILTMLENSPCLPIFPEELLHYAFPESIECPNPKCYRSFKRKIQFQEQLMHQQQAWDSQNSPKTSGRLSSNPFMRSKSPDITYNQLKGLLGKSSVGVKSRSERKPLDKTDPFLIATQRLVPEINDQEEEGASPSIRINESLRKPVVFREEERFAVCDKCKSGTETVQQVKFVLLDCRAKALQREASLPNCVLLDINESYEFLQDMLEGSKAVHHICLIGLSQQTFEKQEWSQLIDCLTATRQEQISESGRSRGYSRSQEITFLHGEAAELALETECKRMFNLPIELHEKMQMHLICDLLSQNFPFVSYVSGGFQHVHDLVRQYNLELNDHAKSCFHCTYHDRRGERLWQKSKGSTRSDLFDSLKSTFTSASKLNLSSESKLQSFMQKNMRKIGPGSHTTDTSKSEASSSEGSIRSLRTSDSSPLRKQERKAPRDIELHDITIQEQRNTDRRHTQTIFAKVPDELPLAKSARIDPLSQSMQAGRSDYPKMFGPRKQITTSMMKPQLKTFEPSTRANVLARVTENVSPDDMQQLPRPEDAQSFADLADESNPGTARSTVSAQTVIGNTSCTNSVQNSRLHKEAVLKLCDCEGARMFDCSKVVLQKNRAGNSEIVKSFEVLLVLRYKTLVVLRPVKMPRMEGQLRGRMQFEVQNKLCLSELERITARAKTVGIITLYFSLNRRSVAESGLHRLPSGSAVLVDEGAGRGIKGQRVNMAVSFEFGKLTELNEFTQSVRQYYRRVKPFS